MFIIHLLDYFLQSLIHHLPLVALLLSALMVTVAYFSRNSFHIFNKFFLGIFIFAIILPFIVTFISWFFLVRGTDPSSGSADLIGMIILPVCLSLSAMLIVFSIGSWFLVVIMQSIMEKLKLKA